jgi:hypothetical protein
MRGKSKKPSRKNLLKGAQRNASKRHKAKVRTLARPYDKRGYDGHSDGAGARGLMGGRGLRLISMLRGS